MAISTTSSSSFGRLRQLPAFFPWLLLVGLTLFSCWLGEGHGPGEIATIAVLVVAFFKVIVVGAHFMELRAAPLAMRLIFNGWAVVICTALIALYLFA